MEISPDFEQAAKEKITSTDKCERHFGDNVSGGDSDDDVIGEADEFAGGSEMMPKEDIMLEALHTSSTND